MVPGLKRIVRVAGGKLELANRKRINIVQRRQCQEIEMSMSRVSAREIERDTTKTYSQMQRVQSKVMKAKKKVQPEIEKGELSRRLPADKKPTK